MSIFFVLLLSYIAGSIPFGYLVVRILKHADIRTMGSGNTGATNVARTAGLAWGIAVFICDFLKGACAPVCAAVFLPEASPLVYIFSGLCAVAGHNWPLFLKFKGGKGVSTSVGAVSGLCVRFPMMSIPLSAAVLVWAAVFFTTRIVSVSSLAAAVLFFLVSLFVELPCELKLFSGMIAAAIIFRHRSNIRNLLHKKEHRFK